MGLTHSGTVAGVAFLAKGEMQALPRVSELGITFYGRFRDDHLIIFDSLAGLKTLEHPCAKRLNPMCFFTSMHLKI